MREHASKLEQQRVATLNEQLALRKSLEDQQTLVELDQQMKLAKIEGERKVRQMSAEQQRQLSENVKAKHELEIALQREEERKVRLMMASATDRREQFSKERDELLAAAEAKARFAEDKSEQRMRQLAMQQRTSEFELLLHEKSK